ncbi:Cell shape-determining protein MreC [Methylacidimicrobium cyclopophantes]|uniref:Cell shape-determining protein MreC n=1 Tax=Methylacidimicrobium cyclopophantes TaxID=1041766 RepID=A0A5E6MI33_9BACT|nr:rod shape-determining protein MreC [Methylacidimicrobium cyclopophantes]VVM07569.1 Cell shape-determining protein MreC [Methylacidimicrobium cyclopophantes]
MPVDEDSPLSTRGEQSVEPRRGIGRVPLYLGAASLFLLLIGLALPRGWEREMHKVGLEMASPFLSVWDRTRKFWEDFELGTKTLTEIQTELKQLRVRNAELAMQNSYLSHLQEENDRLREMLSFRQNSSFRLLSCRVISRDPSNWWSNIYVDIGWGDESRLSSDLPVVTPRGVVGKTGIVARNLTQIILITNENCKISAISEVSKDQGLVVGAGTSADNKPYARMIYLPRNAQVAAGERVLTSGLGGVFPAGLYVGSITQVLPLEASRAFGLYREATVEPGVDLTQLSEMFVVLPGK